MLLLPELEEATKNKIIEQRQLNHHKNRYVLLPVHFNWGAMADENRLVPADELLILQFDGKNIPEVIQ